LEGASVSQHFDAIVKVAKWLHRGPPSEEWHYPREELRSQNLSSNLWPVNVKITGTVLFDGNFLHPIFGCHALAPLHSGHLPFCFLVLSHLGTTRKIIAKESAIVLDFAYGYTRYVMYI
jgi:hypothetical protein